MPPGGRGQTLSWEENCGASPESGVGRAHRRRGGRHEAGVGVSVEALAEAVAHAATALETAVERMILEGVRVRVTLLAGRGVLLGEEIGEPSEFADLDPSGEKPIARVSSPERPLAAANSPKDGERWSVVSSCVLVGEPACELR